jgi:hypothetical protein
MRVKAPEPTRADCIALKCGSKPERSGARRSQLHLTSLSWLVQSKIDQGKFKAGKLVADQNAIGFRAALGHILLDPGDVEQRADKNSENAKYTWTKEYFSLLFL